MLETGFGSGLDFLSAWLAWRDDPQRPRLLHHVAFEPSPASADDLRRGSASRPELQPLADALAAQWYGLLPGIHRLAFEEGRVLLTLCVGEREVVPRQLAHGTGTPREPARALVIGAGLAGAAVAASLARRGWSVLVVDAARQPAAGASSLPAGLVAPSQSPDDNLLSRLTRAGIRITMQEATQRLARGLEWQRTGVLESRGDDRRPLPALGEALAPWSREATEAQKRAAGLPPDAPAWWHETAGWIEPAALVRSWLRGPNIRFMGGWQVQDITRHGDRFTVSGATGQNAADAELVVVAAALESRTLLGDRIQVQPVRGQLTWAPQADDASALPPFPVNGNGHFLPHVPLVERGAWITGSTYGRGDSEPAVRTGDEASNVERVRQLVPRVGPLVAAAVARRETRAWAGVRCASTDRRPLVGEIEPGLWVSTAMGSRGLTFAALCAELVAARLHGEPLPVEARLANALDVARQSPR